jgi:hypothetical protein
VNAIEDGIMQGLTKLLIGVGFVALLSGCVVVPARPVRAYVGVAPAAVVVHPYYGGYYYRRW